MTRAHTRVGASVDVGVGVGVGVDVGVGEGVGERLALALALALANAAEEREHGAVANHRWQGGASAHGEEDGRDSTYRRMVQPVGAHMWAEPEPRIQLGKSDTAEAGRGALVGAGAGAGAGVDTVDGDDGGGGGGKRAGTVPAPARVCQGVGGGRLHAADHGSCIPTCLDGEPRQGAGGS